MLFAISEATNESTLLRSVRLHRTRAEMTEHLRDSLQRHANSQSDVIAKIPNKSKELGLAVCVMVDVHSIMITKTI
jgi:hypothetical protein